MWRGKTPVNAVPININNKINMFGLSITGEYPLFL